MNERTFCLGLAVLGALLIGGVKDARAAVTGTQSLDFDRPESWALKYAASESLFTGFSPPERTHAFELSIGVEVANLPTLTERQRTVGFNGAAPEDLNKLPLMVRPRLTIGLPADFSLSLGYIPPVNINGAQPNLFAASVGRPVVTVGAFRLALRAYGQVGSVNGDFTCPASAAAAGNDPVRNPVGCEAPSADVASLRYVGLELAGAFRIDAWHVLEPHLAIAGNYVDLAFDVHAQYSGVTDDSQLTTNGATFSTTGGLAMPLVGGLRLDVDAFYSPLTVQRPGEAHHIEGLVNGRALLQYRFL